jgi:hemerythrin-like domain-containing protein
LILHNTAPRPPAEEWVQRFNEITMSTARIRSTRPARPARPAAPPMPSFEKLDETHRMVVQVLAELDRLVGLLKHPGHEAEAALLARHACTFFNTTARQHHEAEETFVFPSLLQGGDALLLAHVNRLQQDHNWIEEDWLELEPHLQAVAQGYRKEHEHFLCDALPEFTALYHAHIALEEDTVYPEARRRKAAQNKAA